MAKLVKKVVVDSKGKSRTVHVNMNSSFGLSRKEMPQIESKHMKAFLTYLGGFGYSNKKDSLEVSKLKPTQNQINNAKVKRFQKKKISKLSKKAIVISSDNYILDGHHRWAALMGLDSKNTMSVIIVDVEMKVLIELAGKFSKAKFDSINKALL